MGLPYSSLIHFLSFLFLLITSSSAQDTITINQPLHDGQTLVSNKGNFELGFFSPGSSTRRYVGIWFKKIPVQTVVWVANRQLPLLDSSGILHVSNKSVLILVNSTGGVVWSSNTSRSVAKPVAQLLESGNLLVRNQDDDNLDNVLWQSFDYPCDSQLPGMKLGIDFTTGFERFLTSWTSSDDPSPGRYTYRIDPQGYPQPFLYKDDTIQFRSGPWNGYWFSGTARVPYDPSQVFKFIYNNKEMYYVYELINSSMLTNKFVNSYGVFQRQVWNNHTQGWATIYSRPTDNCDTYGVCGVFSSCNIANSPQCECMKGFVPKSISDWNAGTWIDGCVQSSPLNCSSKDGFIKYVNTKLPDTRYSWHSTTMTLEECRIKCLGNCSCVAFASMLVTNGGNGCFLWINTVIDVKVIANSGQDLYVKVPSSLLGGDSKKRVWITVSSCLIAAMLLCSVSFLLVWWRRQKKEEKYNSRGMNTNNNSEGESELPIYAFDVIDQATDLFSHTKKIGEGGFGPVYKGVLSDGQEIAVKRLSKDSTQGLDEFKNEVIFISKLQHRNLVKLLGCSISGEERLLIYEYMANQSLDGYIFDPSSVDFLDWPKRLVIIMGIARGLLYLHEDSRLRIVHRDLKASNILLDYEMNPKISDFGLARTFIGNQDEAKTQRVVGTYGYMAPEYAIDGRFSVKSDVFSYGVLLLEIVSGKKNRTFQHPDHHHNLLGHAWILFREGMALEVADPMIKRNSSSALQIQRVIHVALLCVQQHPEDRPTMSLVTVMLSSDYELPEPKEPGYFVGRNMPQESISGNNQCSSNDSMTLTLISPR